LESVKLVGLIDWEWVVCAWCEKLLVLVCSVTSEGVILMGGLNADDDEEM